jgi:hypothetical protein
MYVHNGTQYALFWPLIPFNVEKSQSIRQIRILLTRLSYFRFIPKSTLTAQAWTVLLINEYLSEYFGLTGITQFTKFRVPVIFCVLVIYFTYRLQSFQKFV